MLLLDEFINDLDVEILCVLEEVLFVFLGCVVVIFYDCWFLDWICIYILVFEGYLYVIFFEGGYIDYEVDCKYWLGDSAAAQPTRIQYQPIG